MESELSDEPAVATDSVAGVPDGRADSPTLTGKRAVWLLVVYLLSQGAVALVGVVAMAIYAATQGMSTDQTSAVIGQALFPIALLSVLVSGAIVFRSVRRIFPGSLLSSAFSSLGWRACPASSATRAILGGLLLAALYGRVLVAVWPAAPGQQLGPMATAVAATTGWPLLAWALLLLVAAPIEEFLFRGVLLSGFSRSLGPTTAAVIVTVVFVACHLPETRLYYPAIATLTALGTATVVARLRTGSLVAPACLHVAYNAAIALL